MLGRRLRLASRPADLDPLDVPDHLVPRPSQLHAPPSPGRELEPVAEEPASVPRRGRLLALLIVLLGAALAVGVPIAWHLTHL